MEGRYHNAARAFHKKRHCHYRYTILSEASIRGHLQQWAPPTVGSSNSGHLHQWAPPSVGTSISGHLQQWAPPTVGTSNSGLFQQWALPTVGSSNSGHLQQWAPQYVATGTLSKTDAAVIIKYCRIGQSGILAAELEFVLGCNPAEYALLGCNPAEYAL